MSTKSKNGEDIVVVLLSCKWDDTEVHCLQQLDKITPHHYVTPFDFGAIYADVEETIKQAKESRPGLKLLILVNNNKKVCRYNHMYSLHMKVDYFCRACVPMMNDYFEDYLCVKHDHMSPEMQKKCDEQIKLINDIFFASKPAYMKQFNTI